MSQPSPGVDAVQVYQQLAQITAKLDLLLTQHADHEARLRSLERSRWPLPSVTILIALGSAGVALVALLTR